MHTVSLFDAKTHLSRIVDDLITGREDRVVIERRGKPAVLLTSAMSPDVSKRIGLARGRFSIPENIDRLNPQISELFGEGKQQ